MNLNKLNAKIRIKIYIPNYISYLFVIEEIRQKKINIQISIENHLYSLRSLDEVMNKKKNVQ
jgi:hypothetical protein